VTTLFVTGLPEDAEEKEVWRDLEENFGVAAVVFLRRKGSDTSAFVRFKTLKDACQCMDEMLSGRQKVCGDKVKAEMARRNTT